MSRHSASPIESEKNDALVTDERWRLVKRIIESPYFIKAEQLRKILLYVARLSLLDQTATVSEQDIACSVLGRRGDFNPADDNIVRVQMGHIRRRLELYFSNEGQSESLIMSVPKGGYVPHFDTNAHTLSPSKPSSLPALYEGTPVKSEESTVFRVGRNRRFFIITLSLVLSTLLIFVLGRESNRVFPVARTLASKSLRNPLLSRIFVSDMPVSIVVADTSLVVLQNDLDTDISIDQYINKDYPENILSKASSEGERHVLSGLARRKFTSIADLNVAVKCTELSRDFGSRSSIRYSHSMNARDFEKGNFILIGSRTADPWVELFEPQLNFAYEEDTQTHIYHFRNKHPQPGEQLLYQADTGIRVSTTSYVDIAIVPNLTKTGYVLLLNAATMDANEAAIQLLFRDTLPPALAKLFNSNAEISSQSIEIFLRDHAVDGVVNGTEVIAVRKI